MDMILANSSGMEERVIPYDVDFEVGQENTFEIEIPSSDWDGSFSEGKLVYLPGTEFGGIIGGMRSQHDPEAVFVKGKTWRGLLSKKIISPATGDDYYIVSGDLNTCIAQLLSDFYQDDLIQAVTDAAGATVSGYRFERYTDLLSGLVNMTASVGFRIHLEYDQEEECVKLGAVPINTYSTIDEFSEVTEMEISAERIRNGVNHLICLGQGELHERTVVHLYTNQDGTIVNEQVLFGRREIVEVYDNTGAETAAELKKYGIERLKEIRNRDEIDATQLNLETDLEVGDIVLGVDYITGIQAEKPIRGKILRITGEIPSIEYRVEDK